MKRSLSTYALIMVLVAAAVSQALAQYEEDKPSKLSIKVGLYRPSGSALREQGGSTWKAFGVSYNLRLDEMGKPDTCASVEHGADKEDRFAAYTTAMSLMKVWHKKTASPRGPYFGAGAGVYLLKAENLVERPWPDPPCWEKQSGSKLGFSVLGGYNLSENWFAELRYFNMGKLGPDLNFSGIAVYIGTGQVF